MRNAAPADNTVLRQAIRQIQDCLPARWSTTVAIKTNDASDARLTIRTPAGASGAVAIATKRQLDPRLVAPLAVTLRAIPADGLVVAAPFLGSRTRERLASEGIGYVDLAGNLRLTLDRPTVLIEKQGEAENPWSTPRGERSLDGPKACRVVRALCDLPPPLGVRQLAAHVGTDAGYVSRLLALLEREDLIHREPRGPVQRVDVAGLVRRWAQDYRFLEANRPLLCGYAGTARDLLSGLREREVPHAITGRAAAAALFGWPRPAVTAVYVDNPERVAEQLDLRPTREGASVLLLEPFDPVVFDGTWQLEGAPYAAAAQVAADLLGSPPPAPAEAAHVLSTCETPKERAKQGAAPRPRSSVG